MPIGRLFLFSGKELEVIQGVEYPSHNKCPTIHDLVVERKEAFDSYYTNRIKKADRIEARDQEGRPYLESLKDKKLVHWPHPLTWDEVPWTDFLEVSTEGYPSEAMPHQIFVNSIYQVSVWYMRHSDFGIYAHLSFKTHDRSPRHDWREMQRIKNDLTGPETWAVEFYPPESKLVDTSNQYHLYVFRDYQFKNIGFPERCVTEGSYGGAVQRDFRKELRPHDLTSKERMEEGMKKILKGDK